MKGCWMSSRPLGGGDCESGSGTAFQAHLRVHDTWQGLSTLREAGDQKLGKAIERRSIASSWLALAPWTHANESQSRGEGFVDNFLPSFFVYRISGGPPSVGDAF